MLRICILSIAPRRLLLFAVCTLLLGLSQRSAPVTVSAEPRHDTENLVSNPSFETADEARPSVPADWAALAGWPNVYATGGSHAGGRHVESVLAGGITEQGCVIANINWVSQRDIAVDAKKSYTLSFWTRAAPQSATAHEMPVAGFEFFDVYGARLGAGTVDRGPIDISDWSVLSYRIGPGGVVAFPAETSHLRVNLGGAGWESSAPCEAGRIYAAQAFDDVAFAEGNATLPDKGSVSAPNTGSGPGGAAGGLGVAAGVPAMIALVAGLGAVIAALGHGMRRRW